MAWGLCQSPLGRPKDTMGCMFIIMPRYIFPYNSRGGAGMAENRLSLHRGALLLLLALFLVGCQSVSFYRAETLESGDGARKVMLMPPDVELSLINFGGTPEPKADWTATAQLLLEKSLRLKLATQNLELKFGAPIDSLDPFGPELQLLKLHGAVGEAIMAHQFEDAGALPAKDGEFDWSLGSAVHLLRDKYRADYGLFVHLRDSYASAGRAAAIAVSALVFGIALEGGRQVGFASLIDLHTGNIVWINRLARGSGDMRNEEGAADTIEQLLSNFPK